MIDSKMQLFQQPFPQRCDAISKMIDEYSIKELEPMLPHIVEDIFGLTNGVGWNLLNIEFNTNPQLYEALFKFLNPCGPIFRLCYKLLLDPFLKFKFDLSLLPQKVKQAIKDGSASSFYMDKMELDPRTRTPLHLALNPFELYMFHFVYHVVNPFMKTNPYVEIKEYSSLYLKLAEDYLSLLLPCNGSTVHPELPCHYIAQSPHRSIPQKPVKTSTLFRQDVLTKILKQSPVVNTLQTSANVGIWRSELFVQLCLDFWLSMPNTVQLQGMWVQDQLPCSEHLNAVRLFVKHLHYFANGLIEDSSAMDELKKVIIPSSQQKVYYFIRQTMQHWPHDSSFKQILEIWLSYIQPWRYLEFYNRYSQMKTDSFYVSARWLPFITDNILVYSEIFHILLDRFNVIDLTSLKNAQMLFRLTKVMNQPGLLEILCQVESGVGEMDSYSKWIRSHLLDVEGPAFQYKPICSSNSKTEDFLKTVKLAEIQARAKLTDVLEEEKKMGLWTRIFDAGPDRVIISERKQVPVLLSSSVDNLCNILQIKEESMNNITTSLLNTPQSSRPATINEISPQRTWQNLSEIKYEGNPDLRPIRSNENTFLVRFFYYFSSWINYNYSNEMESLYYRKDLVGGLARQILCKPQVISLYDKRVPGISPKISSSLPPRLSLRLLANYHLIFYLSFFYLLMTLLFDVSFQTITAALFCFWVGIMVVRSLLGFAPWPQERIS